MIAFQPNNDSHVAVLIKWWGDISAEDKSRLFHPSLHGLGAFLRFFTVNDAAHLLLMVDERGVWIAAWTSPFWDGAVFSVWIRPDRRAMKASWTEIQLAYDVAFETYPVIFSFTRQPALHATLTKLGFAYAGRLKRAIADAPVYFYELSKEQWIKRAGAARQFRLARREQRENSHARNRVGNQQRNKQQHDDVTIRIDSGEVREAGGEDGGTAAQPLLFTDAGSSANGRS